MRTNLKNKKNSLVLMSYGFLFCEKVRFTMFLSYQNLPKTKGKFIPSVTYPRQYYHWNRLMRVHRAQSTKVRSKIVFFVQTESRFMMEFFESLDSLEFCWGSGCVESTGWGGMIIWKHSQPFSRYGGPKIPLPLRSAHTTVPLRSSPAQHFMWPQPLAYKTSVI